MIYSNNFLQTHLSLIISCPKDMRVIQLLTDVILVS